MLCNRCNTEVSGIRDGNVIWCDNCGSAMKHEVQYVTGYCQSHSCRTQVYCRVKRFGRYISRVTKEPSVLQHYHQLLDLYSCFEFAWIRNKAASSRIYFFAKPPPEPTTMIGETIVQSFGPLFRGLKDLLDFARGTIDSRPVIYHLSTAALFLGLATLVTQSKEGE